jgi:putative membrane protein
MKHFPTYVAIAAGFLLTGVTGAQQNQANRLETADHTFAMKAASGGLAEVELGNLAMQKAKDPKVKEFGQRMVTDHTKANNELKAIAANKGITLPTTLDAKDQKTKDRLSSLTGAAFDRAYMSDMVSDHKADIAEFEAQANHGTDPDLKGFASKTLPTLQEHLRLAESTRADVHHTEGK